jgi:hypothetical protein
MVVLKIGWKDELWVTEEDCMIVFRKNQVRDKVSSHTFSCLIFFCHEIPF